MTTHPHVTPLGYALTFLALLVLSGLTLAVSFVQLGIWSVVIAMAIAGGKALLVALFFMHLIEQRASNRFVALSSLALVGTLIALMVVDVDTRPALLGDVQLREEPVPEPVTGSER